MRRGATAAGICAAVLVALVDRLLPGAGAAGALVAVVTVVLVAAVVFAVVMVLLADDLFPSSRERASEREAVAAGVESDGGTDELAAVREQYERDLQAWRQQNMVSAQDQRAAERLLALSQRARAVGDREEAERLAREAYALSDAAEWAYRAAEQRVSRSRQVWQHAEREAGQGAAR